MNISAATPSDAAAVAKVHIRSGQVGYRGLLPQQYLDSLHLEDRVTRYSFGSADPLLPSTLVSEEDGVIHGFVTTGPSRDPGFKVRKTPGVEAYNVL